MIFKVMKYKYRVTSIYDDTDLSKYFILVTIATIHEIQVLPIFNIFENNCTFLAVCCFIKIHLKMHQ